MMVEMMVVMTVFLRVVKTGVMMVAM